MDKSKASRIIRETRDIYNSIAKEWDISRERPSGVKMKVLKLVKPGYRVLDLGCGNGFMTPLVLERGGVYEGLDISKNLINIARQTYRNEIKSGQAKFQVGEVTKLPYPGSSFDVIISFAVLHHIPSPELRQKFFIELARVLKPGGQGVVIVWNLLNDWSNKRFKIQQQLKEQGLSKSGDVLVPWKATGGQIFSRYLHLFNQKELINLAKLSGLKRLKANFFTRSGALHSNGEELMLNFSKLSPKS